MEKLVGRVEERQILENALKSNSPELIAVTGRRRVGKTFLIRSVYEKRIAFEFSAVHNTTMQEQLGGFIKAYQQAKKSNAAYEVPGSWFAAFALLEDFLTPIIKRRKAVVFFDEFPWMHTPRSNFLKAFEQFWNTYASRHPDLKVVICGSAASWMIQNVVNNRGGLHNRLTRRLKLLPFSLKETEAYLISRSVNLDRYQLLQLYMVMGGIPEYLKQVAPGKSSAQIIDNLFFTKQGALKKEFDNLYPALFENATRHVMIIRALASASKGMTRKEIIESTKLNSGGWVTQILDELEESGFIMSYLPFNRTSKDLVYRLSDEYSL
ncbi:MAG TPA: ATP-binding protein, partial [Flavitalea sp.]|nr:ATP-binding protein [Flavitalea sp.]